MPVNKKKNLNPNFAEFLAFLGLVWIGFPSLSIFITNFGKLGHVINEIFQSPAGQR